MRKTILATSLAAATLGFSNLSFGQAAAAAPAPDYTLTGNLGLFSSYRFRGIAQTYDKPAVQGGIDFSHVSGFYAGNWDSNINEGAGYPGGSIEMDFYGGWKKSWGDWGLDLGGIYYYYPGTNASATIPFSPANNRTGQVHNGRVDNGELYIGGSWKWISLKYSHAVTDYFSAPSTKNSYYVDLSANYDLGDGWGVNGHVGHLNFKNMTNGSYTDWKLGVTKDLGGWVKQMNGWVVALSYIDSNTKGNCNAAPTDPQPYCFSNGSINTANASGFDKTKDAGKGIGVISISKSF